MELQPGTKLGPYEIVSAIGSGGMGEVWKARDPRLNRDVAIKTSRVGFSGRFQKEAHSIAALNHPNICTLYDVGPDYLVMEFIEGPTLAERILQGPVPLEEAMGIARQIADALEAAHQKTIVHRDLKPTNVKIRPGGSVKVLDFGLAKASEASEVTGDSPTHITIGTQSGLILGTAGYMSPEQARGEAVDKRADIWAFGVVLYEMLTGKRLFDGATVSDSLAAILKEEPDLTPAPARTRRLLARCLEKDPKKRLRDIGDWQELLVEPAKATGTRKWFAALGWVVAGLVIAAALFVGAGLLREKHADAPKVQSTILPPENTKFGGSYALSPDGRHLVFRARKPDGPVQLWLRALDSLAVEPLAGTDRGLFPFWSADSRSIGFVSDEKLRRIDISGGPPVTLADAPEFRGASWSRQGVIVFAPNFFGPLQRIPASGGTTKPVTVLDPTRKQTSDRSPWFLPDGRHFLYASTIPTVDDATIYVADLDSNETHVVTHASSNAVYASGYLFFLREDTLIAQAFDSRRLQVSGEVFVVAEKILGSVSALPGGFGVSENGTLVFQRGALARSLAWLDSKGQRLGDIGEPGGFLRTSLSPDNTRAIVSVFDRVARNYDLWVYDLERNRRRRFTFDPGDEQEGVWSPDGNEIIFGSSRKGHIDLYRKLASGAGTEELLYADGVNKRPMSWSKDGKFVMYYSEDPKTGTDLWVLPLGGEKKPFAYRNTKFKEELGQFSPDRRWVAYTSDESGSQEVYIAPFPGSTGTRQVSIAGGDQPRWRADGRELFYIASGGRLMAAQIDTKGSEMEVGAVRPLFMGLLSGNDYQYDVAATGNKFLAIQPFVNAVPEPLTLLQNWRPPKK